MMNKKGGIRLADNLKSYIEIRRDLHQIPEIGFREYKTQRYLLSFLKKLPQDRLEIETWKTGILVRVLGRDGQRTIGYRADMDGLPITEQTDLPFSSAHVGQMHACGHDFHMSIAVGVLEHFVHHPIADHLLFIFQPAEEGPGGAKPLLDSDIMKKWMPDRIMALTYRT